MLEHMDETDVVIVGAGPSGLALAVALAHYKVKSIVIEKNVEVCEDPRAIGIAGDTQRILELLGLGRDSMLTIGAPMQDLNYHSGSFNSKPFFTLDHTADWLEQAFAPGMVMLQPGLEELFRKLVREQGISDLRLRCEVTDISEAADGVLVKYRRHDGTSAELKGKFVVGADGKRGYVRKCYLEEKGIEQNVGEYSYNGSWIAANLKITMPTPETHPQFPLWKFGYEPDELWDIFWPPGFHFCRHPTMPVATGRFGPASGRYWRFEYELPHNLSFGDPKEHLMEQIQEHLTMDSSRLSRNGISVDQPVEFPQDCIQILRCAPAHFVQKVVNRWFHNRVMVIGDAAHVFPPFGGQGIANGIRDAFALSWRLALLSRQSNSAAQADGLLSAWSSERRKGVGDASVITAMSGNLFIGRSFLFVMAMRAWSTFLNLVPSLHDWVIRKQMSDAQGYSGVKGGCFLAGSEGGGTKLAQIWMQTSDGELFLSDRIFWESQAALTVVVLQQLSDMDVVTLKRTVEEVALPAHLLTASPVVLAKDETSFRGYKTELQVLEVCPASTFSMAKNGIPELRLYDQQAFRKRFNSTSVYALVRSDFIIFSQAKTLVQLKRQLEHVPSQLSTSLGKA